MIFFSRLNVLSESFFETLVGVVASIIDAWLTYTTYRKYRKRMRKLNYSYIIWVRFCNFVMIEDVYIMWQWHYIGGEILVSWEAKLLLQINSIGKPKKYRFRRRDWIVLDKVIPRYVLSRSAIKRICILKREISIMRVFAKNEISHLSEWNT